MKKRKIASAVSYSAEDPAPRLLVSGAGHSADRIIALARENGIAIVEDSALAALLASEVKPGDMVPFWCWEAIARVLAFVRGGELAARVSGQKGGKKVPGTV